MWQEGEKDRKRNDRMLELTNAAEGRICCLSVDTPFIKTLAEREERCTEGENEQASGRGKQER